MAAPAPQKKPEPRPALKKVAVQAKPAAAAAKPAPAKKPAADKPNVTAKSTPAPLAEALIRDIAARHKSPSPPVPSVARAQPGPVVQIGAFADTPSADKVIGKLRAQGFDSYLSKKAAGGRYPHRVRVRPAGGANADALAGELARRGYDVWITRE